MVEPNDIVMLPEPNDGSGKYSSASDIKQERQKELIIEQLRKTPVIQIVCEKLAIGRTTYYRWRQEDKEFAQACDEALEDGCFMVNDLAESQLMAAIRDQNITAIMFWLKNHHVKYANKLDISGKLQIDEKLNEEQEAIVRKALQLASLMPEQEESTTIIKQQDDDKT
jgi:hypothetical protein